MSNMAASYQRSRPKMTFWHCLPEKLHLQTLYAQRRHFLGAGTTSDAQDMVRKTQFWLKTAG